MHVCNMIRLTGGHAAAPHQVQKEHRLTWSKQRTMLGFTRLSAHAHTLALAHCAVVIDNAISLYSANRDCAHNEMYTEYSCDWETVETDITKSKGVVSLIKLWDQRVICWLMIRFQTNISLKSYGLLIGIVRQKDKQTNKLMLAFGFQTHCSIRPPSVRQHAKAFKFLSLAPGCTKSNLRPIQ